MIRLSAGAQAALRNYLDHVGLLFFDHLHLRFCDERARQQCLKALQSATGLLRGEFARRAHLRVAPELEFHFDYGIERGQRIFELLHSVEGDLKPRSDGDLILPEPEVREQA